MDILLDSKKNITTNYDLETLLKYESFAGDRFQQPFLTGRLLVFITRPELFIRTVDDIDPIKKLAYNNMSRHPFLSQFTKLNKMNDKDQAHAEILSYDPTNIVPFDKLSNYAFIPVITNKVKGFDFADSNLDYESYGTTKSGFSYMVPSHDTRSKANGQLSLQFTELSNMDILKPAAIWYEYIGAVSNGTIRANPNMIHEGKIDYMSSIYCFVLGEDMQTVKFWAKYTGCFPINNPWSALSSTKGQYALADVPLNFVYHSKEEMTLSIINDFNNTSLKQTNIVERINLDDIDFNIDRLMKDNVLSQMGSKLNKVPIVYIKNITDEAVLDQDRKNKKLVIKLGLDSMYRSFDEQLFGKYNFSSQEGNIWSDDRDIAGLMGDRRTLYDQTI